ncbi:MULTISPECIES: hypothetical protein [unclassified Streptomyces]|uniref:hypothetical protein n=1 Tax=unclassified Streptomyces TaxID=2593676 RepID=UPI00214B6E98|nr:hypothetical protein [Streptomyces sp. NBC_00162]UUU44389.1 hypothetical protein JIW86_00850 [Streptomyces sp. NBC_00162]
MALRFIGIDPNSDTGQCPTVWVDEATADVVIQGWKADQALLDECLETGAIPDTEGVVRIPARMVTMLREACDAAERRAGL